MRKKNGHCDCSRWAHAELTVTKMVKANRDLGRDWTVIILKMLTASCDLAVIELWPRRDWAVT